MAENESLDLGSPRAGRWFAVLNSARKGDSCHKVGRIVAEKLSKTIRIAIQQFEEYGVTTDDFLDNRASPETLSQLVRQTKGHLYAKLLMSVIDSNPNVPGTECLHQWLWGVIDTVFDQIRHRLGGSELFPSCHDATTFLDRVRGEIPDDVELMAANLGINPHWKPSVPRRSGASKIDTTAELLSMSLVGGAKQ